MSRSKVAQNSGTTQENQAGVFFMPLIYYGIGLLLKKKEKKNLVFWNHKQRDSICIEVATFYKWGKQAVKYKRETKKANHQNTLV